MKKVPSVHLGGGFKYDDDDDDDDGDDDDDDDDDDDALPQSLQVAEPREATGIGMEVLQIAFFAHDGLSLDYWRVRICILYIHIMMYIIIYTYICTFIFTSYAHICQNVV